MTSRDKSVLKYLPKCISESQYEQKSIKEKKENILIILEWGGDMKLIKRRGG